MKILSKLRSTRPPMGAPTGSDASARSDTPLQLAANGGQTGAPPLPLAASTSRFNPLARPDRHANLVIDYLDVASKRALAETSKDLHRKVAEDRSGAYTNVRGQMKALDAQQRALDHDQRAQMRAAVDRSAVGRKFDEFRQAHSSTFQTPRSRLHDLSAEMDRIKARRAELRKEGNTVGMEVLLSRAKQGQGGDHFASVWQLHHLLQTWPEDPGQLRHALKCSEEAMTALVNAYGSSELSPRDVHFTVWRVAIESADVRERVRASLEDLLYRSVERSLRDLSPDGDKLSPSYSAKQNVQFIRVPSNFVAGDRFSVSRKLEHLPRPLVREWVLPDPATGPHFHELDFFDGSPVVLILEKPHDSPD